MDASRKSALVGGLVLVAVGVLFLVGQLLPDLWSWVGETTWPLVIVGAGAALFILGLLARVPAMAVPACIVAGIGGLLYWQNTTGNWESWAYAWALIPGFSGAGAMIVGLLEGKGSSVRDGLITVLVSLILFAIFASFLGGPSYLGRYWPVLLIALGIISLARYLAGTGRRA